MEEIGSGFSTAFSGIDSNGCPVITPEPETLSTSWGQFNQSVSDKIYKQNLIGVKYLFTPV
jgi:hypothetical protein